MTDSKWKHLLLFAHAYDYFITVPSFENIYQEKASGWTSCKISTYRILAKMQWYTSLQYNAFTTRAAGYGKNNLFTFWWVFLLIILCGLFFSRTPWWSGTHLVMAQPAQSSSWIHTVNEILKLWFSVRVMFHICPSWKRDPSSVALPQISFHFFTLLQGCFCFVFIMASFSSLKSRGLRTEDVFHCTKCKARWSNVTFTYILTCLLCIMFLNNNLI